MWDTCIVVGRKRHRCWEVGKRFTSPKRCEIGRSFYSAFMQGVLNRSVDAQFWGCTVYWASVRACKAEHKKKNEWKTVRFELDKVHRSKNDVIGCGLLCLSHK